MCFVQYWSIFLNFLKKLDVLIVNKEDISMDMISLLYNWFIWSEEE